MVCRGLLLYGFGPQTKTFEAPFTAVWFIAVENWKTGNSLNIQEWESGKWTVVCSCNDIYIAIKINVLQLNIRLEDSLKHSSELRRLWIKNMQS